jgi:phosphatidylserine decarboxylase
MVNEHNYVHRDSNSIRQEALLADAAIAFIYSAVRERAPWFFNAATGPVMTSLLGFVNYDLALNARLAGADHFRRAIGLAAAECLLPVAALNTPRKIFERQIAYWRFRPMDESPGVIVSPADSRMFIGSIDAASTFFLKGKFFDFCELVGAERTEVHERFAGGDCAVFRLTPDKYHYNHLPVSGVVRDIYRVDGRYHSCNPSAAVAVATPLSKNRRVVTLIDTDVAGGSGVGQVAMIEVVAMMIGSVVQCYSAEQYDQPVAVEPGLFVRKGQPKSLFRPGSSSVVLLFEPGRMTFSRDLLANQQRADVTTRFSAWLNQPLVETEVSVRATIGRKVHHG